MTAAHAVDTDADGAAVEVVCETAGSVLAGPAGHVDPPGGPRRRPGGRAGPCPDGLCGTCETRVLDGEPDHRDALLTAEERASGETMLICVSRGADAAAGPRSVTGARTG